MATLATWIYGEERNERSRYAQMRGDSSSPVFQAIYWRCVYNYFWTARAFNPSADFVLVTNLERPPVVDGIDVDQGLRDLGVQIALREYTRRPARQPLKSWGNQFYVFDALEELVNLVDSRDVIVLTDSDCIWLEGGERLISTICELGSINYDPGYSNDWGISGLDLWNAGDVWRRWGLKWKGPARYAGGEFVGATVETLTAILDELDVVWGRFKAELECGDVVPTEEAHLLSYLYARLGFEFGTANGFIHRLWTGPRTRNSLPLDAMLTLAHLPSEKRRGMVRLFRSLAAAGPPDAEDLEAMHERLVVQMGIDRLRLRKICSDMLLEADIAVRQAVADTKTRLL